MSRLSLFGYVAFTVLYVAFYVVLVLGLAGSWRWTEGWIFLAIFDGMIVATTVLLMRRDPELLRQRFGSPFQEGQPASDKVLLMIITDRKFTSESAEPRVPAQFDPERFTTTR